MSCLHLSFVAAAALGVVTLTTSCAESSCAITSDCPTSEICLVTAGGPHCTLPPNVDAQRRAGRARIVLAGASAGFFAPSQAGGGFVLSPLVTTTVRR